MLATPRAVERRAAAEWLTGVLRGRTSTACAYDAAARLVVADPSAPVATVRAHLWCGAGDTGEYGAYANGSKTRTEQALEEPAAALGPCEVFGELVKLIASHDSCLSSCLLGCIHHANGVRCSHAEFPLIGPFTSFLAIGSGRRPPF